MKQIIKPFKGRLYNKFLIRAYEAWREIPTCSKKDYLDFKTFYQKICRSFSITKIEAFELLKMFEELGYFSFVKFRGVQILYEVKNANNK
jgi:hypothetical protein